MTKPSPVIIHEPTGTAISPVVFDNPHNARSETLLWDAFMDRLLAGVPGAGIPVLETEISRTVIDTNREIAEIDPSGIQGVWPYPFKINANVRRGLGLIPFLIKGMDGVLTSAFNKESQLTVTEVKRRIDEYYTPYYDALTKLVNTAHQHHGISVHFNFHSSPRLAAPCDWDIIIGDRYGKSAAPLLVEFVRDFMKRENLTVGINNPYPGGALIEKTADPANGRHSLQIEIARDLYMDQASLTYDVTKGDKVRDMLTRFAAKLQNFTLSQADALKP